MNGTHGGGGSSAAAQAVKLYAREALDVMTVAMGRVVCSSTGTGADTSTSLIAEEEGQQARIVDAPPKDEEDLTAAF